MSIALPAQLDEPTIHRGIAVVPLFPRRDPGAAYTTLEPALRRGLRITETSAAGSVPELVVTNPLAEWVLLYDGEELVGAKQNRILNLTVLVAAESVTPIPVSCVEAGRWNRRSQAFAAARHMAGPQLRLRKARALGADALARGRGQHEVWQAVAEQADRRERRLADRRPCRHVRPARAGARRAARGLPGPAGAVRRDARPARRARVPRLPVAARRLRRAPSQAGGRLPDGALDQLDRPSAGIEPANRLLHRLSLVPLTRRPSAGLGIDLRAQTKTVAATGLEH